MHPSLLRLIMIMKTTLSSSTSACAYIFVLASTSCLSFYLFPSSRLVTIMNSSVPFHLSFLRILTVLYSSTFVTLSIYFSHDWVTVRLFHVHWSFSYRVCCTRILKLLFSPSVGRFDAPPIALSWSTLLVSSLSSSSRDGRCTVFFLGMVCVIVCLLCADWVFDVHMAITIDHTRLWFPFGIFQICAYVHRKGCRAPEVLCHVPTRMI